MKKLIFIILIGLFSCNDNSVTISKQEYNKLTGGKLPKYFSVNSITYTVYTGSDGHEYYEMRVGTGGYSYGNRHFHYPDCEKCKKRDTLKNK